MFSEGIEGVQKCDTGLKWVKWLIVKYAVMETITKEMTTTKNSFNKSNDYHLFH